MGAPSSTRTPTTARTAPTRSYADGPRRGESVGSSRSAPLTLPSSARPSSSRSEPIGNSRGGSNLIDLGSGAPSRPVAMPRSSTNGRSRYARRAGAAPGDMPGARSRSRSSSTELARARAQLAQRTARTRARTVTRSDILQRYRGSGQARAVDSATNAAGGVPAANRDARIADARSGAASDRGASAAAGRIAAARGQDQAKQARIADAREKQQSEKASSDQRRTQAVRDAREQTRIKTARQDYLKSVAQDGGTKNTSGGVSKVRDGQGTGDGQANGDGDGYDDGYNDGFYDTWRYGAGSQYWNTWGGGYSWFWGPSWYAATYWWHGYWYYGGYYNYGYRPRSYYYGPFVPYSSTVYPVDNSAQVIYIETAPQETYVEQAPAANVNPPAAQPVPQEQGLGRAADYYLTLGDRAFREARFGDAVHYYAKAVEYSPSEGILYLILADALFATGDYHYAAYSLRRALELDPELANNVVDKHSFYGDPADFDRQLAVLERYLEDHFLDDDARLVLAANYLFGARPAASVELLQSPYSKDASASPAGQMLLKAAQAIPSGREAVPSQPAGEVK